MRLHGIARAALLCVGVWVLPAAAHATTIGPDAFGYTATNEVPFAFVDISATGTRVLDNVDDQTVGAAIGFDFNFYGTTFDNLFISSNGILTFGAGNSQFGNVNLATASPTGNGPTIAPAWDDWVTNDGDAIYYQTVGAVGSRQFIVQWNDIGTFGGSPGRVTFEALLFEASNNILFQYLDMDTGSEGDSAGASATVGIRNTDGHLNGQNLQWSFNQAVLREGEAILISPQAVPEPTSLLLLGSGAAIIARRLRRRSTDRT